MPGPLRIVGWDVGGAHLKACLLEDGRVRDVAQWICPLWQGLGHLHAALAQAHARWPQMAGAQHALTMTGEMTDLFADREDGVLRLAETLQQALAGEVRVYAGPDPAAAGQARWVAPAQAAADWPHIASANWLATAQHAAAVVGRGLLIDIGSTTTDFVRLAGGTPHTGSRSDRDRLASGELAYHGVVRTPLCALGPRITLQGQALNVMNEFFASSADVYRLTDELDPAHDLYPPADGGAKSLHATRARLARMVGCDVRDASEAEWLAFARAWRGQQLRQLADALRSVLAQQPDLLDPPDACIVAAGAGAFLVPDLLAAVGLGQRRLRAYGQAIVRLAEPADTPLARWAQVCAPSVAVAALRDLALR
jgi:(4-(4-[2-(gamma-L-glutamylamino)ethyl]phenoxymethyl)furan-2-yl)methanamine synthase